MHKYHLHLINLVKAGSITKEQAHKLLKEATESYYANVVTPASK